MSEHTSFYEKIGITPLINASETYTNLGGSLMDERTVEAMRQAGEHFVDYPLLLQKVSERAAELTNNESAFVTTGAAGGEILSAAAAMKRSWISCLMWRVLRKMRFSCLMESFGRLFLIGDLQV